MANKGGNYNALKYVFIFKRSDNLWNSAFEFENDLKDFLIANGLDAEPIQTVEGNTVDRMLIIKKAEFNQTLQNTKGPNLPRDPNTGYVQKSQDIVKNLTKSLTKGGRK